MSDTPKLTITFKDDGTVDWDLEEGASINQILSAATDIILEVLEAASPNPRLHNRAITVITQKLERAKKEEVI